LNSVGEGQRDVPPILGHKDEAAPSVFEAQALLRQARRQKGLDLERVPTVCLLDPDGDILRRLKRAGLAKLFGGWPCYHTELHTFALGDRTVGIVGCAVGAPFAVLVAEELFACGCGLLVSLTSAGQIVAAGTPPYFVIIDRALRDEGTSYHYAAASDFATADARLVQAACDAAAQTGLRVVAGPSWTTDAPFRETAAAVLCLAHVTNTMGLAEQDFEKGEADGTSDALRLLEAITARLRPA
jgi:hypothetical protein